MKIFLRCLSIVSGVYLLLSPIGLIAANEPAQSFSEVIATKRLLEQLRSGGYVLYMRHGRTDNSKPDRVPAVDLQDCATQRPLTEEGRKMAADVGAAIRRARIPVGDIRISPLCRVRETTQAAFPERKFIVDDQLMYVANLTDAQKLPIVANTRYWLSQPVKAGTNRLLIGHAPNLMELIGYFPKEGTVVVFRPGEGVAAFTYVASIPPGLWSTLSP